MTLHPKNHLDIRVISSKELSQAENTAILEVCNRAYEEDFGPILDTFSGATHVLGYFQNILVSHALWVTRWLQVDDAPALRTAYVEAVATEPAYQRRGFATAIMQRLAQEIQDFDLAALSPFSAEYYQRLGWELWRGPLLIRQDGALIPTPDDEEVMIMRLPNTPPFELTARLSAEWREGELW
jgi:aminoglycoside 2'-N-acetyltransferase I